MSHLKSRHSPNYIGEPPEDYDDGVFGIDNNNDDYIPHSLRGGMSLDRESANFSYTNRYLQTHPLSRYPQSAQTTVRRLDYDNPKQLKEPKTLRGVAIRFASNTSLQGVPFINRANRWYAKLFWTCVFLAATCAMLQQCYAIFNKYYARSTTTSVNIGYANLELPSITLCNINPIKYSKVEELGGPIADFVDDVFPKEAYSYDRNSDWGWEDSGSGSGSGSGEGEGSEDEGGSGDEDNTGLRKKRQITRCNPGDQGCLRTRIATTTKPTPMLTTSPLPPNCEPDDPRCKRPSSPCDPQDPRCKSQFPSLFGEDQFVKNTFNFTTAYESYDKELDDDEYNDEDEWFGTGDISWQMKLREEYREVMSTYGRNQRAALGHEAPVMILTCEFNGRECFYWNFTRYITNDYGNCYTFNSAFGRRVPLKSKQGGTQYGLTLVLYLEEHEYIHGLTQGHGIRMVIHPFNTMPFVSENGISLAPGTEAYIGMRMVKMTRLGRPYTPCGDNGIFTQQFGFNYTTDACINTCLDRTIASKCGCYSAERAEIFNKDWDTNLKPCSSKSQQKCLFLQRFRLENGSLNCNCKQACETVEYDLEISHNSWPDPALWWGLVDAVCERDGIACDYLKTDDFDHAELLKRNFILLHVYYRDLNYQTITEIPDYEYEQFMSDFGGTIGLWLGASFITGMEVLDFIVQLCVFCSKGRQNTQHKTKQKPKSNGKENSVESGTH